VAALDTPELRTLEVAQDGARTLLGLEDEALSTEGLKTTEKGTAALLGLKDSDGEGSV